MYKKQAYVWPKFAQSELSTQGRNSVRNGRFVTDIEGRKDITKAIISTGIVFILAVYYQISLVWLYSRSNVHVPQRNRAPSC